MCARPSRTTAGTYRAAPRAPARASRWLRGVAGRVLPRGLLPHPRPTARPEESAGRSRVSALSLWRSCESRVVILVPEVCQPFVPSCELPVFSLFAHLPALARSLPFRPPGALRLLGKLPRAFRVSRAKSLVSSFVCRLRCTCFCLPNFHF